jgi:hypothetical protein
MGGEGGQDYINGMVVDSAGSIISTGQFTGLVDFDPGPATINLASNNYQGQIGLTDIFLSKVSRQGKLLWARRMGGSYFDRGIGIMLDNLNKIYAGGAYQVTTDFDLLSGVNNRTSLNSPDGYLAKYAQCITRTQIRDTICFGSTKSFDGETLTKSGKYIRLQSYNPTTQCEVWEELFLHVRPEIPASAGADASVCSGKSQQLGSDSLSGLSYQWQELGGTFTSTQARPSRSFTNFSDSTQRFRFALRVTDAKGCQKRDTITLSIAPVLRDTLVKAICPGENFLGYDTAGTYTDTLVSSLGCDSIRTLALSIKPKRTFNQSIRLCKNQSLQVGTRTYTQPGIYLDTLTASNGCDSLITSTLNYDIPNDTILLNGLNFTAADNQDSYQWLDCNQGFLAISGATQQSFTPTSNGSYAVKTTKGNCADTSNCVLFTSGKALLSNQIRIYPQPVKDKLYIEMPETSQSTELILIDAMGRIVVKEKGRNIQSISVLKLPAGLYQLKVFTGKEMQVFAVMIDP